MTRLPRWVLALALAGAALIVVPLVGLVSRLDAARTLSLLGSRESLTALSLSVRTAAAAAALCLLLGVPLGMALHRLRGAAHRVVRAVLLAPLVLPPVVGGLALLYAFGRRGLLGGSLEALGASVAFTTAAVVIAQTFVALPFMVVSVESALASRTGRLESIAATLGARPGLILRRVTLPALRPALITGLVLAFARALGEFGATLTFAGSVQGVTRTAPLEIYLARETDPDAAVALGVLLLVLAVAVVALAVRPARAAER